MTAAKWLLKPFSMLVAFAHLGIVTAKDSRATTPMYFSSLFLFDAELALLDKPEGRACEEMKLLLKGAVTARYLTIKKQYYKKLYNSAKEAINFVVK